MTRSLYRRMKLKIFFFSSWKAPLSWMRYNTVVIDFVGRHTDQSLVVPIQYFICEQDNHQDKLSTWLDVELDVPFEDFYRPSQMNKKSSAWLE